MYGTIYTLHESLENTIASGQILVQSACLMNVVYDWPRRRHLTSVYF